MSSERTAVQTDTVTDASEQENRSGRLLVDTPVDGNGERIGIAREKPKYKSIPENWKAIPPGRFRKIIGDIESVLLEISVDGKVTLQIRLIGSPQFQHSTPGQTTLGQH